MDPRSRIPGLDRLLQDGAAAPFLARFPRPRVVDALRRALDQARAGVVDGAWEHDPADPGPYWHVAAHELEAEAVPSLRPVLNATGVVLHTNLGRAPLAPEAVHAMQAVSPGYSTLEFDLESGRRGSRYDHCAGLLAELTGAEDAVVVNNCAAALVLVLNATAAGRGVVVSRGELVEIGGGFRIPDMLERAGTRMVEVGSTNRTRTADYEQGLRAGPVGAPPAAVLKVHRSNFRVSGFTEEAPVAELVAVCRAAGVPLIHDVGSGLLVDPAELELPPEPRASTSMAAGVDVAVFSGDKLLGGPQAGLIVGRAEIVSAVRDNPLCRALRVDKATLAALEATLRLYRDPATVRRRVPVLRMLTEEPTALEARARTLAEGLTAAATAHEAVAVRTEGRVGGGTYPEVAIPGWGVRIETKDVGRLAAALRSGTPAVVARVEDDGLIVDVRTIPPEADGTLCDALLSALEYRP
ncbi:MAG: L-seryl-tRNA(Sec) selenium transferase [Gemmatimonadetes bacterium]|nr:L-seryl-tRNA(Sec) selenium transferase [Gemmatimonadota bacterium]